MTNSEFHITCDIAETFTKQITTDSGELETKYFVRGRASGIGLDLEYERMAESAIDAFQRSIKNGMYLPDGRWSLIPLISNHEPNDWSANLGWLIDAHVDKSYDLYITAELDADNPNATLLYKKLTRRPEEGKPVKLGLSVGGKVIAAEQEWDDALKDFVRVYKDVDLREVSVVSQPAYPTAYLTALQKSVNWDNLTDIQKTVEGVQHMEDENIITDSTDEQIDKSETQVENLIETEIEAEVTEKQEEPEVVAEVEKEVEVAADEQVEKTDAQIEQLRGEMQTIMEQVTLLANAFGEFATKSQSESGEIAEKQVEETEATPTIEKNTEAAPQLTVEDIAAVVKSAIGEAFKPLEERIKELEETPIDKSFSITDEREVAGDPLARFQKAKEGLSPKEALELAIRGAY